MFVPTSFEFKTIQDQLKWAVVLFSYQKLCASKANINMRKKLIPFSLGKAQPPQIFYNHESIYWNRMQLPLENLTWNYGEDMVVCEEFETALYDLTVWFPEKTWNVERKWFSFSQGHSYTYFIQTPDHTCLWCKIANNAGICTCLISQQEDNKFPFYPRRGFCSMLVFYSN